jgi:hypothetical protein
MATKIQIRRDSASNWTSNNPTLSAGEFGFETDTGKFKIGTGSSAWTSLSYSSVLPSDLSELSQDAVNSALTAGTGITKSYDDSANTITISVDSSTIASKSYVDTSISNLVDLAPGTLYTLNEIAAAINDDPSFFSTIATNLSNHESDTTSIHGIADTAALATKTYADTAVSTHSSDTTSVHGITDTAELATKTFAAELLTNATKTNIAISGDKNGLTITAENGVADSTTDNLAEGSTNKYFTDERAQDAVATALGNGTHSGITVTYSDNTNAISLAAGAAIVPSGSIETASPATGQLFFDTDVNSLKIFYGGIWLVLATVQPIDGGLPGTSSFDYSYDGGGPSTEADDVIDGGTP